jgi:hypothetical protein
MNYGSKVPEMPKIIAAQGSKASPERRSKGYHLASVPFPWSVIPQAEWGADGKSNPQRNVMAP